MTVAQLALALGVEAGFFLPGSSVATSSVDAPHFRSLRATSQVVRDQAYAFGQLAVAVAAGLERHVEFPQRDVERVDPAQASPEEAARAIRESWSLDGEPIRNLVRLAETHGF